MTRIVVDPFTVKECESNSDAGERALARWRLARDWFPDVEDAQVLEALRGEEGRLKIAAAVKLEKRVKRKVSKAGV